MKKIFISQPMRDKTDEQILAERKKNCYGFQELFLREN